MPRLDETYGTRSRSVASSVRAALARCLLWVRGALAVAREQVGGRRRSRRRRGGRSRSRATSGPSADGLRRLGRLPALGLAALAALLDDESDRSTNRSRAGSRTGTAGGPGRGDRPEYESVVVGVWLFVVGVMLTVVGLVQTLLTMLL